MISEVKTTILLVEDEAVIAMFEKKQLEEKGYIVHHVNTGEKAIETIAENGLPLDLVLMDIDLGSGIDGTLAAQEILKIKDMPVVFLSSHNEPEIVQKTEKITSYGYVVKNSGIIILDASIKMAIKLFNAKLEHKNAKAALQISEENLSNITNSMQETLSVIALDGTFLYANQNASRNMLGDNYGDIIGKNIRELITKEQAESLIERYLSVFQSGKPFQQEIKIKLEKGDTWFYNTLRPIEYGIPSVPAVLSVSMDITCHKKSEYSLQHERMMLARTESIAHIGSWEWDIATDTVTWSEELFRIFGRNISEGAPSFAEHPAFCHPHDMTCLQQAVKTAVIEGKPYELELKAIRNNGETRVCIARGFPEKGMDGDVVRLFGSLQDITERKQAEEEIQKQLVEKEILLREVHHRIKNNIANIESFLMLQNDSVNSTEAKNAIKDAISRVQSMRILYDKLLLSKDHREISIKEYIENLIDSLQVVFSDKGNIIIEKQIADFNIIAKQAITIGIIINELLTNVFKYAFKDSDEGTISLSIEKTDNIVTAVIKDNGVGIDERIMKNKSPGFGLTIVKMLVEQLGGTYAMKNDNGTKSVIHFEL